MNATSTQAASQTLIQHWQQGTVLSALPEALRPGTREEGYAVQAHIESLSQHPLFGWKIAATSTAGQRHIGVSGPLAGRLLKEMVFTDGATLPFGANRMRVAEAEFAFQMARSLAPRPEKYTVDEVMAAVNELFLAIEVPDSRFADFATAGGPQLIADNACAHQFVLGPAAPAAWRTTDLASHHVVGRVSGREGTRLEREGLGANVLGDPRLALTWMANELSSLGVTLQAGQLVTTGTCVVPLDIQPGDSVYADFGPLGMVSCRFTAA